MIAVQLKGGLGNQMFQYAAARRLAYHNNTRLGIDLTWFDLSKFVDAPREYELGCFNIVENFVLPNKDFVLADDSTSVKTKIYTLTKGRFKPRLKPFIENSGLFDKAVMSLPDNTFLDGFWQSEKYFSDARNILLKEFSFKKAAGGKNRAALDKIKGCNSVSLHVRRGDYVSNKQTSAKHGVMGLDYYKRAVELINKRVRDPAFFVFSDDPAWCKANLKLLAGATYIDFNKAGSDDLRLMMNCRHNIIANSSFSWWGAWLNQNDDKIVIGPKKWFNDSSINTRDVLPSSWLKI